MGNDVQVLVQVDLSMQRICQSVRTQKDEHFLGTGKFWFMRCLLFQGFLWVLVAVAVVVVGGGAAGGGGGGGGHLVVCWRFKLFKSGWWINILGPSTTNFVQISMVPDLLSINIWGLKTFWSLLHPSGIPKMKNFYWRFDKSPHLETPLAMIQLRIGP